MMDGEAMKAKTRILVGLAVAMLAWAIPLHAQDEEFGEDSKLNTNAGISWTVPTNPTAQFVNFGWGVMTFGAGYNFSKHHAVIGEFMWNSLYPTNEALRPFRLALHTHNVNAHGNLLSWTANYRFEVRGESLGAYFIGGGGLYFRTTHITKEIVTGTNTTCTPAWLWWGFTCTSGIVDTDQTLASSSSGKFGVNGGIGFTVKVGEPRYRMYIETRFHYAPHKPIKTEIIPVTIGIRF